MPEKILTIVNKRGLHARAAAKFVKLASGFDAEITLAKDGTEVSGRSIMGLMMLAATTGDQVALSVKGADADDALQALSDLVSGRFREE